jgi:TrmH family RNA methyltransferase
LDTLVKSFHSSCEELRKNLHLILVHPDYGGNIGSAARAVENMGVLGSFRIVANREKIEWSEVRKMSKHAFARATNADFFPDLRSALTLPEGRKGLSLGTSSRVGSSSRPHPLKVRPAVEKAIDKLKAGEITDLFFVFGNEADGLSNEECDECDWLVTIPSHATYRSLNLAQSVMVLVHEANENLLDSPQTSESHRLSQREKIIQHLIQLSEESGFILPQDPFKMRPRLEEIFGKLPPHIPEAKTLHGLIDQVRRSLKKGEPDIRGRYKKFLDF